MFTKTRNEHIKDVILLLFSSEKLENFEELLLLHVVRVAATSLFYITKIETSTHQSKEVTLKSVYL